MKSLSLVVLVVSLLIMTNSAFAGEYTFVNAFDNWTNASIWLTGGGYPAGSPPNSVTTTVKIRGAGTSTHCTLNTNAHALGWTTGERLRVYEDANMVIADGAYIAPGWMRAGAYDGIGVITQTGGTVEVTKGRDESRLVIGDDDGSDGLYHITGGTLTYNKTDGGLGQLIVGDRGGIGRLLVEGTGPTIDMNSLYVGGRAHGREATGTLEFNLTSDVSPINVVDTNLAAGPTSTANLIVTATNAPTEFPVVLVKNSSATAVIGFFDSVDLTDPDLGIYTYLRYNYDAGDGTANDIVLVPEPATLVLLALGSLVALRRKK